MEHLVLGFLAAFSVVGLVSLAKTLLYFVITIFILVTVHEFGHFIAGRIFGMHVPVFSVGMGRRILGWNKLNGFTVGPLKPDVEIQLGANTDYRLSVLPLGGYAKIDGMIDETQTEALPSEIQPWEFRAKPWWQKTIVISAGVIMNILLALLIFSYRNLSYGDDVEATTTVGWVHSGSVAQRLHFQPGDRILAVNNQPVSYWEQIMRAALAENVDRDFSVTYERSGHHGTVIFPHKEMGSPDDPFSVEAAFGLDPIGLVPPKIDSFSVDKGIAEKAGLLPGDQITRVNGDSVTSGSWLVMLISSHPSTPITLDVRRTSKLDHSTNMLRLNVTPGSDGTIGIQISGGDYNGPKRHISYGIGKSIALGWDNLRLNVKLLAQNIAMIFTGKIAAKKALGGPIKIAQLASKAAQNGGESFIVFMAMLSISLACLNILPVPALDGGHLIIIWAEAIIGHELSQRFKMNFQKVGVALLLTLMLFMVYNDISGMM